MDLVSDYLWVPEDYAQVLGGIRWAASGEAIDYPDGDTFALTPQVGLFLEGFANGGGLIHFAHVLHLLHLFGLGRAGAIRGPDLLHLAFLETGQRVRNAGALAALLCRPVPRTALTVDAQHVGRRLASRSLMAELCIRWAVGHRPTIAESPPLSPSEFAAVVREGLARFTAEELRHWLLHGHIPILEPGEQVAESLDVLPPRSLEGVLAELADSPRLAGARPLVEQLTAALALPPRRRPANSLPSGGYADVATRGHPEQILPSQFALDDLEFVRRHAENELLYFRREEPHQELREELIVLLDQGVRTWGTVRLVLAAAVLALGRLAARRKLSFRLAATSAGGKPIDPLAEDGAALRTLVEASDLSPQPGAALETLLETPAETPRDVVLLTHPRSLQEPDVEAAACRAGRDTRLFALAVNDSGDARLSELRHGHPVSLSAFRLDLAATRQGEPERIPAPSDAASGWTGDVEAVPFSFRFGVPNRTQPTPFDFDHAGNWVLETAPNDMLHAWRTDGSAWEVLPRPAVAGVLLTSVESVLGVLGGFAVWGKVDGTRAVAHYDFQRRHCCVYLLGRVESDDWAFFYFPDSHTVVARGEEAILGVSLTTGERVRRFSSQTTAFTGTPLETVCDRTRTYALAPPEVLILATPVPPGCGPALSLESSSGTLLLWDETQTWRQFRPIADGQPVLAGAKIRRVVFRGNLLAVLASHPNRDMPALWLFSRSPFINWGEFEQADRLHDFTVSADGHRMARRVDRGRLEVRDLDRGLVVTARTPIGGFRPRIQMALGEMWLTIRAGTRTHLFRWDRPALEIHSWEGDHDTTLRQYLGDTPHSTRATFGSAGGLPAFADYDRTRFVAAVCGPLTAVVDAFGQVAMFENNGTLVCMLFAVRRQAAAWMPDGTRLGLASLTGSPPTPDAAERIAVALQEAWRRGKEARP